MAATPCVLPSLHFNSTLLTHEATQWLPPRQPAQPEAHDPVIASLAALAAALREAQRPSSEAECRERGVRLSVTEGGFGSTLNGMVKPMVHALLRHKLPLSAQWGDNWGARGMHLNYHTAPARPLQLYANRTSCESESIECFLQPLSNCSVERRLKLPAKMLGQRFYMVAPNKELFEQAPQSAQLLIEHIRLAGNFNTVALVLSHLVRPSATVSSRLAEVKRSLGWPDMTRRASAHRHRPLIIGVHLRAGDSCAREFPRARHNRTCEPLSAYLPAINTLRQAYGSGRQVYVYLSTDDERAAAEARGMSAAALDGVWRGNGQGLIAEERLRSNPGDPRWVGAMGTTSDPIWLVRSDEEVRRNWRPQKMKRLLQIEQLLRTKAIDGYREAFDLMVDVMLLVECDAFVVRGRRMLWWLY